MAVFGGGGGDVGGGGDGVSGAELPPVEVIAVETVVMLRAL